MSKFKLFKDQLLERLMREPAAFAIVNSAGDVDIESMAWSQVPSGVQAAAMEMAQRMLAAREIPDDRRETVQNCELHVALITVDNKRWAMVSAASQNPVLQQKFAREDVHPLCHWD
jgi:hypothetical protein